MLPNGKNFFRLLAMAALAMCGTICIAQDNDSGGNDERPACVDAVRIARAEVIFVQECTSCHIGYPPRMLPTESWRNIMATLEKHFGMDASLPAREIEEITVYLADSSTDWCLVEAAPRRISETDWFQRKHNAYVISPDIWGSRAVKSPANCTACHRQAWRGDFSEQYIRVPQ